MTHCDKIEQLKNFAKDLQKYLDSLKNVEISCFASKFERFIFNRIFFYLNEISNYVNFLKENKDIKDRKEMK